MPKAFLILKKKAAKDFMKQAYWQDSCYQPDTPPPSPEEELQGVNKGRRAPAQSSQLAQLSSNGIEPMAGPSGLSSHLGKQPFEFFRSSFEVLKHFLNFPRNFSFVTKMQPMCFSNFLFILAFSISLTYPINS